MEQPEERQSETIELDLNVQKENYEDLNQSTSTFANEDGSNGFGKFKDAQSLLDGYNKLEAEFTRKCQKLAELTKLQNSNVVIQNMQNDIQKTQNAVQNAENITKNENNLENSISKITPDILEKSETDGTGLRQSDTPSQEQTDKVASENESTANALNFNRQVKNFFAEHSDAKKYSTEMSKVLLDNPKLKTLDNAVELAYLIVSSKQTKSPQELVQNEEFINNYVLNSPEISRKVLSKILDKTATSVPKIITSGAGAPMSFGSSSPKTLSDARDYVLQQLKEKEK